MSNHAPGIAKSLYRQLRLTVTHETNGRLSYRLMAKPLNAAWSEHHVLATGASFSVERPLLSMEDVLLVVVSLIEEEWLLPLPTDEE